MSLLSFPQRAGRALLLLAALLPGVASAAMLTQVYAAPYVMSTAGASAELPLPVTLANGTDPAKVCVENSGVQFLNVIDGAISAKFTVEPTLIDEKKLVPTLRITVNDVDALLPGVYQLNLRVFFCGKETIDFFPVPITRPGIKLEKHSKVTIDRWLTAPWSESAYRVTPPQMTFRPQDNTGAARVGALRVEPSNFTMGASNTNVGSWTIPASDGDAADRSSRVPITPSAFPIGTASGQMTVRGNNLLEPLQFDVDVRTRLVSVWILVMVVLGVLAGTWLRMGLQLRITKAAGRQPALDKLRSFKSELDGVPDATFHKAVEAPLKTLFDAVNADDQAAIDAALANATSDINTARAQLNLMLTTTTASINAFRKVFDVQARLPAKFVAVRDDALHAASTFGAMLYPPNPTAAISALEEKQGRLLEGLADARTALKGQLAVVLDELALLSPFLADAERVRLTEKITGVDLAAQALVMVVDLATASTLLTGTAQLGRDVGALLVWSAQALELNAPKLDELIASRQAIANMLDTDRAALKSQIVALAAQVSEHARLGDMFVAPLWSVAAKSALTDGLTLLERLATGRTELQADARAAFLKKVADGHWQASLTELKPRDVTLHAAAPAPMLADVKAGSGAAAAAVTQLPLLQIAEFTLPALAAAAAQNKWQLARDNAKMAVIVGTLLAAVSYAIFEEKFIGNWGELLALFFWGFSADLSMDKLAERVRAFGIATK